MADSEDKEENPKCYNKSLIEHNEYSCLSNSQKQEKNDLCFCITSNAHMFCLLIGGSLNVNFCILNERYVIVRLFY